MVSGTLSATVALVALQQKKPRLTRTTIFEQEQECNSVAPLRGTPESQFIVRCDPGEPHRYHKAQYTATRQWAVERRRVALKWTPERPYFPANFHLTFDGSSESYEASAGQQGFDINHALKWEDMPPAIGGWYGR